MTLPPIRLMMTVSNSIFPANIIAFTSDRTVDFTLRQEQTGLNDEEEDFLSRRLNIDLPDLVLIRQTHGFRVVVADESFLRDKSVLPEADGAMTRLPNVALTIRTADCLPVFMYDPEQKGIGLVHVGRRGAEKNILREAITQMKAQWQTEPKAIMVFLGPAIRSCCYEVDKEFQESFPEDLVVKDGRHYLDLVQVCRKQLIGLGLEGQNIHDSGICTCCDEQYFSYRRQGESAGRMLSLMMLKEG